MNSCEPFVARYINYDFVKLLDQNGQFHNSVRTLDAQRMARDLDLDLVCFSRPLGNELAFCKIINFNKWKYEEEKRKKKMSKEGRRENKEIRLSPNIAENDIAHKMKQVNEFLDEGDEVTLIMKLKGREKSHFDLAEIKMNEIIKITEEHGKVTGRKRTDNLIIVRLTKLSKTNINSPKTEIKENNATNPSTAC